MSARRHPTARTRAKRTATNFSLAFWTGVRRLIMVVSAAALLAALFGYSNLATTLIYDLLISAIVVSVLFLLRGLLRELIGFISRSVFLQHKLGLRHRTRSLFKTWTRALLDIGLFLAGLVLLVAVWGAPFDDLWLWAARASTGFVVGSITISPVDILVGIGVFVLVLIFSRLGQRVLAERVLPRTKLDSGVQNSLAAGWWYLGIVLAVLLGVVAIGIDLSSIALIAGALSVGIGFGLQNIANNFISGLILLIERPVKVGDWVVLGQNEGFVKQINLRSTEIETFQRASIILPNADIISNALINWTHKDRYGRIDVSVTVALDAPAEEVRDIMLAAAAAHPRVGQLARGLRALRRDRARGSALGSALLYRRRALPVLYRQRPALRDSSPSARGEDRNSHAAKGHPPGAAPRKAPGARGVQRLRLRLLQRNKAVSFGCILH